MKNNIFKASDNQIKFLVANQYSMYRDKSTEQFIADLENGKIKIYTLNDFNELHKNEWKYFVNGFHRVVIHSISGKGFAGNYTRYYFMDDRDGRIYIF